MILTLIPALMGSRAATTPPEAQAPVNAATRPNDGPGFAALFLALLGGSVAPSGDGVAPDRHGAVLDSDASPTPGDSPTPAAPGGIRGDTASVGVEGDPDAFRPAMAAPEGRTTTAGWAALAGAGRPAVEEASSVDASTATEEAKPREGAEVEGPAPSVERGGVAAAMDVAPDAAVSAAAVTTVAGPGRVTDVRTADRALEKLDPELRAKVERVIERMASEHGHRVEVVEGYRSAERQRFLYAQGRTRPGPVVTWTKESHHMDGHAADLKVEGPWAQRDAYVQLQKIAREEGLGTLGMKDPGHVELLRDGARTASRGSSFPGEGARAHGVGTPMVASSVRVDGAVARTAPVARVADVARTARVAAPGTSRMPAQEGMTGARSEGPVLRGDQGAQAPAAPPVEWVAEVASGPRVTPRAGDVPVRANAPSEGISKVAEPRVATAPSPVTPPTEGPVPAAEGVGRLAPTSRDRRETTPREKSGEPVLGGGESAPHGRGPSAPVTGVGAATGADPLAQMDRVEAIRQAMASANPSRVTVRLDGTAGPVDRVQVELLDQALRGQVDVGDADLAAQLRGDVGALIRTLEEKGYDPQSLAVKLTANAADATRDGMAGWLRTDSAAQALRTILGAQAGSAGRDAHDRSQGEAHQGRHDPHGTNQQSRRDNRRDGR